MCNHHTASLRSLASRRRSDSVGSFCFGSAGDDVSTSSCLTASFLALSSSCARAAASRSVSESVGAGLAGSVATSLSIASMTSITLSAGGQQDVSMVGMKAWASGKSSEFTRIL